MYAYIYIYICIHTYYVFDDFPPASRTPGRKEELGEARELQPWPCEPTAAKKAPREPSEPRGV